MNLQTFYKGPWKLWAPIFIVVTAVGGYFFPVVGLVVPLMILGALILNQRSKRTFCSTLCPNGRFFSSGLSKVSRRNRLPRGLYSSEIRRMLCGFMLFCVINLLVRSGGSVAQIGRVFWAIYLLSVGLGTLMGLFFKPRSWCSICPMGTLQDTISTKGRGRKAQALPSPK
jgi:polyferredoxin